MADEDENKEGSEVQEEVAKPEKKKSSLLLYIIILVVLIAGGVAAVFLTPLKDKIMGSSASKAKTSEEPEVDLKEITFLTLPEVIVNLKSTKGRGAILKAQFIIELATLKDKDPVDRVKPLIIDQFQSYLRELELTDLQGAAGLERIRQELQNRVSNLVAPVKIRQVLFKDFLIQ
jgi:flagellar FliL protein